MHFKIDCKDKLTALSSSLQSCKKKLSSRPKLKSLNFRCLLPYTSLDKTKEFK